MTARYPRIDQSNALWARAQGLIPSGAQTLAKAPGQWSDGVAPKFLARGKGARVWDVDGNEYVDLVMGVGPVSLGYAYPAVDEAIVRQLRDGISFTLIHPLEVEVAERVREVVPGVEMVRYSKTGADATSAAIRVARAFTGREKVLCCGYHGWHDWYITVTDRNKGIPAAASTLTHTFQYNDLASVEEGLDDETAAVILEPTVFEAPRPGFLEGLRRLCDAKGALLVFDEMWTGFRLALGGAQQRFGVRADLVTYSKAVANGMPLSILAGRREVMRQCERDVFFYTTFGGETLSLAAAKATIEIMQREPVFEHFERQGQRLIDGYNAIARDLGMTYTECVGYPARSLVKLATPPGSDISPLALKTFVQQEMIARGVLWGGFHNLSYSHGDAEVAQVLGAYREVLPLVAEAAAAGDVDRRLRGKLLEPVFRKVENFHTRPVRR
jgi:glutamate-1-semialdehyde aminotransferase